METPMEEVMAQNGEGWGGGVFLGPPRHNVIVY